MYQFLGDPESGCLDLESHCLAPATTKKTLDETDLNTHKDNKLHPPNFKIGNRYTSKTSHLEMGFKMESWLQDCLYSATDTTSIQKSKLQEKLIPAVSMTLCMNCQSSYRMMTQNLAELESLSIIP